MARFDVVCVGTAITDIPLRPVDESVFETVSYPVENISMQAGGDALNESIILSRLGAKVALVSAVGSDAAGDFIRRTAVDAGVDTEAVLVKQDMTTSMNIGLVRPNGERTFITNKNGSLWTMQESDIDVFQALNGGILAFGSIFNNPLLSGRWMAELFAAAKGKGMVVCADMVPSRIGAGLSEIADALSYVDYFFPNAEEAMALTGADDAEGAARILKDLGVGTVVLKLGRQGCLLLGQGGSKVVPAFPRDDLDSIDTTGAGDNFAAGFIRALLDGRPAEDCAVFANGVAAVSVGSLGATSGVRDRDQVNEFITERLRSQE